MSLAGWIGVDLDGTLAYYDRFVSDRHIGAPVPAMVARVKAWLAEGKDVRIFTARAVSLDSVDAIEEWCATNLGVILRVTNTKDYGMIRLYDDRCVQVEANTGRLLGEGQ